MDADMEDVGGGVKDTHEEVADYFVVDHSDPGASFSRVLDQQCDGVRGASRDLVIADGDELTPSGQLDVLKAWGIQRASWTNVETIDRHVSILCYQPTQRVDIRQVLTDRELTRRLPDLLARARVSAH